MNDERTPSRVVFPEPVPPDTTTFALARTQAPRKSRICAVMLPRRTRSSGMSGLSVNLRIVTTGPQSERGGRTREHPRTVRESGVHIGHRLIDPQTERGNDPFDQMEYLALPLKNQVLHLLDPPLPLHVYVVGPIDHDLADLRVPEQPLDWSEADDFVRNLIHHVRDRAGRQDRPLLGEHRQHLLSHPKPTLRGVQPFDLHLCREQPRPDV